MGSKWRLEVDYDYFKFYSDELRKALYTGVKSVELMDFPKIDWDNIDEDLINQLEINIWQFSMAKTAQELVELNSLVNTTQSFSEFKTEVLKRFPQINRHLRTEWNQAQLTAQAITRYNRHKELAKNDRFIWWEYQTVGDERVRNKHRELDGVRFRYDDPIWDTIYPPNGWNCRCVVVPRKEPNEKHQLQTRTDVLEKLSENGELEKMKKANFANNRAERAEIYYINKKSKKTKKKTASAYKLNSHLNKISKSNYEPSFTKKKTDVIINELFEQHKIDNNVAKINSINNTPINILKERLKVKAQEYYRNKFGETQNMAILLPEVTNWIQNPDEVWLQKKGNAFTKIYIKYSKKSIYTAIARQTAEENNHKFYLFTWYEVTKETALKGLRNGILLFNK